MKTAEHCSAARVEYFASNGTINISGGKKACHDYYEWEKKFFPCFKVTPDFYKNNEIWIKMRRLIELHWDD